MTKIIIKDITPKMGLPGGLVTIHGKRFQPWDIENGHLHFTNSLGWIEGVSDNTLLTSVPDNSSSGDVYIDTGGTQSNRYHFIVPEAITGGLHLVDNPAVDSKGYVYATYSGNRGEVTPVSVYKLSLSSEKEVFASGITNATSLTVGKDDKLYIASRYDGKIYKSMGYDSQEVFSQGLGTAFGLACDSEGELFVGDRTGSIFRINSRGQASFYTSIPQSYIAFHLAFDSEDNLYVSNPVHMGENSIYRIDKKSLKADIYFSGLSLFHGFAISPDNNLYLAETKRNESRIIKIVDGQYVSTVLTGTNFIGLSFDNHQNMIVATTTSLYLIENGYY